MQKNTPQYAHFGQRFLAMMIDNFVFIVFLSPIFVMLFGVKHYSEEEFQQIMQTQGWVGLFDPKEMLIQQLIILAITVFFWMYFAGTPGKRLLKLRVVDATTGKNLNIWQSVLRYLGYIISSFPMGLGFVWILLDEKNQGWHDKLVNSIVVRDADYRGENGQANPHDNREDDDTFTA